MFSLEVSDYQDSDAREKINDILVENLSTSDLFSIQILLEKMNL